MTLILTAAMLRDKMACEQQVFTLEQEWPNGLTLDESAIPRIVELGLSVDWFVNMFLKTHARQEYKRVKATAWQEYERVTAPAWQEYKRVTAPAWQEYERVTVAAAMRLYIEQERK